MGLDYITCTDGGTLHAAVSITLGFGGIPAPKQGSAEISIRVGGYLECDWCVCDTAYLPCICRSLHFRHPDICDTGNLFRQGR